MNEIESEEFENEEYADGGDRTNNIETALVGLTQRKLKKRRELAPRHRMTADKID